MTYYKHVMNVSFDNLCLDIHNSYSFYQIIFDIYSINIIYYFLKLSFYDMINL